jgi:hypothetical protein
MIRKKELGGGGILSRNDKKGGEGGDRGEVQQFPNKFFLEL